jgi:peptidoglycan/xylan/chitin deacetylase (PgdA/CDA1 family)
VSDRATPRRRVTVVMYHFVRDLRHARYPRIKGLDSRDFGGQLDYVRRHYRVVRMEDILAAIADPARPLPERALLLTFDDGYADHYQTVFPLLDRHGLQGSFYPPARAILERRVLDVNKVHFLLAAVDDGARLVQALEDRIDAARDEHGLQPSAHYRDAYAHANRWDTAEVVYLKRMLQKGLPPALRAAIADELFREFVARDETVFAEELYVSIEQLRCMQRHGMHIGSHGHDHLWLDTLDGVAQERQVTASLGFLREIGADLGAWTMAYPYGGHDASLRAIVGRHGCRAALATEVAIADLDRHDPLALPRIDTNDLPRSADAATAPWTLDA